MYGQLVNHESASHLKDKATSLYYKSIYRVWSVGEVLDLIG